MAKSIIEVQNTSELAKSLGVDFETFRFCVSSPVYSEFTIRKKSGGTRKISSPDGLTLNLQRKLNRKLQTVYNSLNPGCVYGFTRRKKGLLPNIVENANVHVNKRYVMTIDIMDFFPSITSALVLDMFMKPPFNYGRELAKAITLLCCYNGCLPTGAASSPVVSNLVLAEMDKEILEYAETFGISYTRYADDLTFSADFKMSGDYLQGFESVINKYGFRLNKKKQRETPRYFRQVVTGIVVNDKVNVKRKYLKELRAVIHDIRNRGYQKACAKHFDLTHVPFDLEEQFRNKVKGMVEWVGMVKGKESEIYREFRKGVRGVRMDRLL